MKKIILYIIPMVLVISSCEDFLTEDPVSQLSAGSFWTQETDLQTATASMYDGMQTITDDYLFWWAEARSDNFIHSPIRGTQPYSLNGLRADINACEWGDLYQIILRANLIIENAERVIDATEAERNGYLSQAYAMRAFCHLLGVKVWGDVPLILQSTTDADTKPEQAPVADVLAAVVEDLLLARELANPDAVGESGKKYIDEGGVLAILTDAYMWQRDYARAIEVTDELITLGYYQLEPDAASWKQMFSDQAYLSLEMIWVLGRNIIEDGGSGYQTKIGVTSTTSEMFPDYPLIAKWEDQWQVDFRPALTYDAVNAYIAGNLESGFVWKFQGSADDASDPSAALTNQDNAEVTMPMFRWADILLMRAEALNQTGDQDEAVNLLNQIRNRAGLGSADVTDFDSPATMSSTDSLEMAILEERQIELFGEGKRWFDLRRTGRLLEVMDPITRQRQINEGVTIEGFGDPESQLFPIGESALLGNDKIVQNSAYRAN